MAVTSRQQADEDPGTVTTEYLEPIGSGARLGTHTAYKSVMSPAADDGTHPTMRDRSANGRFRSFVQRSVLPSWSA